MLPSVLVTLNCDICSSSRCITSSSLSSFTGRVASRNIYQFHSAPLPLPAELDQVLPARRRGCASDRVGREVSAVGVHTANVPIHISTFANEIERACGESRERSRGRAVRHSSSTGGECDRRRPPEVQGGSCQDVDKILKQTYVA